MTNNEDQEEQVKILLVDDRPSNLLSLKAILDNPSYTLVSARSGEEALTRVLREDFAVILLDVAMPRMDGLETAQIIKQRERSKHTPILFVTASVYDIESITRAYEAGAVDYLQKPVDPLLVRSKVEVFVQLYRQRRQIERQAQLLRESAAREQDYELRRREADRRRFLGEASGRLLGSLEREQTVDVLCEVLVPRLAEVAVVYVRSGATVLPASISSVLADSSLTNAFARLTLEDLSRTPEHPLYRALEMGESHVQVRADEAYFSVLTRSEVGRELAERNPIGSVLTVPLTARGRSIGAILLGRKPESEPFGEEEVSISEELGRRAAIALENARLYAEARAAVQLRDEFLSVASHELRTPLTALQLYLQHLQQVLTDGGATGAAPAQTKVAAALRQMNRLARLVQNLLDVSRIGTGRLQLDRDEVDLAVVVREVLERFGPEAARAGCELRVSMDAAPTGTWDRLRLEQVLDNLLSNAIKYAPGRPVDLKVGQRDGTAEITVTDRGIGINAADLDRIFGRFERAVPSRNYGGLGLGLFIARQIVEAHGGTIHVQSDPEEGSSFTVQLPLTLAAQSLPADGPDSEENEGPLDATDSANDPDGTQCIATPARAQSAS